MSRYAKHPGDNIRISSPLATQPISADERVHLQLLHERLPELTIPDEVRRHRCCTFYNIAYRGISHDDENARDSRVAFEVQRRRSTPLRIYGQLRYFLALSCGNQRLYVAYVDWFKMFTRDAGSDDPDYVCTKQFVPASDRTYCKFVPIGEFVCKVALLPASAKGHKSSVLELL